MIKTDFESISLKLAIFTTVVSFSTNSMVSNICEILSYFCWGLVFLSIFQRGKLSVDRFGWRLVGVYVLWYLLTKVLYAVGEYPSGGLGVVGYLPFCFVFYSIGKNYTAKAASVAQLVLVYTAAQIVLLLFLLPNIQAISSAYYLFSAKNQTGQMLGIGIILELFIIPRLDLKKSIKLLSFGCGVLSLFALLMVHSRTPVIGIAVTFIIYFITKKDKQKKDYLLVVFTVAAAFALIQYLGGVSFIKRLFGGVIETSGTDASLVLSGRLIFYQIAIQDLMKSPIWGVGAYAYIDSFLLNALRCGGFLLAVLLFPISYGKMLRTMVSVCRIRECEMVTSEDIYILGLLLKMLIPFYLILSLMEGYPPLGPGTTGFFFWILLGLWGKQKVMCIDKAN